MSVLHILPKGVAKQKRVLLTTLSPGCSTRLEQLRRKTRYSHEIMRLQVQRRKQSVIDVVRPSGTRTHFLPSQDDGDDRDGDDGHVGHHGEAVEEERSL